MSDSLTLQKIVNQLLAMQQGDTVTEQQQFMLQAAANLLLEYKELSGAPHMLRDANDDPYDVHYEAND